MAIAFLISSLNSGGAERVVSLLSKELSKSRKVYLITLNNCTPFYQIDSRVKLIQLNSNTEKNIFKSIVSNIKNVLFLIKFINENKISRLICFMTSSNQFGILCKWFVPKLHLTISERGNPYRNIGFRGNLRKVLYRYSDRLVVQTTLIKDYFAQYMSEDKISIIKNPIEIKTDFFVEKSKIILTVGSLNKNKNQAQIISAFSMINAPDWQLHICGSGSEMNELKRLTKELDVEQKVTFFGSVNNIDSYYKNSLVFAFSSNSEGFPNVLLEAMNHGCACISTDCPTGPSELIEHEVNGYLIPLNDLNTYCQYLQKIVDSENIRKDFSQESKKRIQKYNLTSIANQWIC